MKPLSIKESDSIKKVGFNSIKTLAVQENITSAKLIRHLIPFCRTEILLI